MQYHSVALNKRLFSAPVHTGILHIEVYTYTLAALLLYFDVRISCKSTHMDAFATNVDIIL